MNIAKILTFLLIASTTALNGQHRAISRATNQQNFDTYLQGVALSCASSIVIHKALNPDVVEPVKEVYTSGCDTLCNWVFPDEQLDLESQLTPAQKQQAWLAKKQRYVSVLKKITMLAAAYFLINHLQKITPQVSLYQAESSREAWAVFIAPYVSSWLLSKGVQRLPVSIQQSALTQWLLLVFSCCANYLAVVQVHGFFQPYTMPTTTQHIFNFTGNYLAPNVCCQFIS